MSAPAVNPNTIDTGAKLKSHIKAGQQEPGQTIDTSKDGFISQEELTAYYKANGADKISISPAAVQQLGGEDEQLSVNEFDQLFVPEEADSLPAEAGENAGAASGATPVPKKIAMPTVGMPTQNITLDELYAIHCMATNDTGETLPRAEFDKKATKYFANGTLTEKQHEDLFDRNMTTKWWKAFTGGKDAVTKEELYRCYQFFIEERKVSGISWYRACKSTKIVPKPSGQALKNTFLALGSQNPDNYTTCVKKHYATVARYLGVDGMVDPNDTEQIEELVEKLTSLASSKDDKDQMTFRIIMKALYNEMYMQMKDKKQVPDLSNPIMAERFAATDFRGWLLDGATLPSEEKVDEYADHSETLAWLKEFGSEPVNDLVARIDVDDADFDEVLNDLREPLDSYLNGKWYINRTHRAFGNEPFTIEQRQGIESLLTTGLAEIINNTAVPVPEDS